MSTRLLNKIVILGAVAGMRTMLAPALLSSALKKRSSKRLRRSNLRFMQSGSTATVFKLLAAGELVGDKLPMTPNRTELAGLIGRGVSGALVGATLAKTQRVSPLAGAGVGLSSALVSTHAFYLLRKKLSEDTKLPDILWASSEDILAIKMGKSSLQK